MNAKRVSVLIFLVIILILSSLFLITKINLKRESITGNIVINTLNQPLPYEFDKRNQTIIFYNQNYNDGQELAEYYADARGISRTRICPLELPPGAFVSSDLVKEARRKIVEECICDIIDETYGFTPNPCTLSNIDTITNMSPITHMVSIKGLPSRLYLTGWPSDYQYPPFDYYLSLYIYAKEDIFGVGKTGNDTEIFSYNSGNKPYYGLSTLGSELYTFQPWDSIQKYVRTLNASIDRRLVFGRVEAINKERTKDLIDRTISAENQGIKGNFAVNINNLGSSSTYDKNDIDYVFLSELTSNNRTLCDSYIDNNANWNYTNCRTAAAVNGFPGMSQSSKIPKARNISLYLGDNYAPPNSANGFVTFDIMKNWTIGDEGCIPLCIDMPSQSQINSCIANSKDYYKELNTDCVSAPNLIGWQYLSYPAYSYGSNPKYWEGLYEIAPQIIEGDSYKDTKFTDNYFMRFGNSSSNTNPTCSNSTENNILCNEKIFLNFAKNFYPGYVPIGETTNTSLSFSLRYPPDNSGKIMRISSIIFFSNGSNSTYISVEKYLNIGSNPNIWNRYEHNISINRSNIPLNGNVFIDYERIGFYLTREENIEEWLDFDGISFYDKTTNTNLLPVTEGSFNSTDHFYTGVGDYPLNTIDRLGGIGWWGSSSHHLTGGHAYKFDERFLGAFFGGRTLAESIAYSAIKFAYDSGEASGMIFADPLYNPAGVKIYSENRFINNEIPALNKGSLYPSISDYPYLTYVFGNSTNNSREYLKINAFNGRSKSSTTRWNLSVCYDDKYDCLLTQNFKEIIEGRGSAYALKLPIRFIDLVSNKTNNTQITVKLRVWNIGEENNDLVNYASLYYNSTGYEEEIIEGSDEEDNEETINDSNTQGSSTNNTITNTNNSLNITNSDYLNYNNGSYNQIYDNNSESNLNDNIDTEIPKSYNFIYQILIGIVILIVILVFILIYILKTDKEEISKDDNFITNY